jgi:chemotaxis protein CheC
MGITVEDQPKEFTEMELSALNEIGNIIAGAYLSSLTILTNILITSSVPYMAIDMAGAILSVPAIEFGKIGDKALLIETEFGDENNAVNGYFILIPTLESYGAILSSLGL